VQPSAQTTTTRKQQQQQKNTAAVARAPHVTHAMIAGQTANQVAWQSQGHVPSDERTSVQAMTTKNTMLGKNPLIRGCLLFDALAQPLGARVCRECFTS
jgi:hypothetical protein